MAIRLFQLGQRPSGFGLHRLLAGEVAEALERGVDILRLKLEAEAPPARALRRDQRGA